MGRACTPQKKFFKVLAVATAMTLLGACSLGGHRPPGDTAPLSTVDSVDLHRYAGLWYEIGRLPNSFQEGCSDSSALYTPRPDGEIDVLNSCRDKKDATLREARGRAWVVDGSSNARLKVSFFWPFRGDYWIIDLDSDYQYAVVGTPDRKYLWILSRSRHLAPEVLTGIIKGVEERGFNSSRLLIP